MIILPAIDIRGGRCVRLRQGRFQEETVYDEDPAAVARRFEAAGAEWLHVVDLDGAREGEPRNLDRVRAIREAVGLKMEVGGGIRSTEAVEEVLEAGADRIVVGTRAVREPEWLKEVAEKFPAQVALGLDQRKSRLAIEGWKTQTRHIIRDVLEPLQELPLAAIICTDIERDGTMAGAHYLARVGIAALKTWVRFPIFAAGGIASVQDIINLKGEGADGAIVGRALYEGKLTLEEALAAAAG